MGVLGSSLMMISLEHLRVGMFVTKLDVSWLDSPFLSHSRLIKKEDDIRALEASGVKVVTIDMNRGLPPLEPPACSPARHPAAPSQAIEERSPTLKTVQASKTEFNHELRAARVLRGEIKRSIEDAHRALELEGVINVAGFTPLIDATLGSLSRNNQALMSLVHLSRKAQRVADHVFSAFCLTLNLAVTLKLSASERQHVAVAALLHEAGWVQIPLNLMGKRTPYTAADKELIAQHPSLGSRLLKSSHLPLLSLRVIEEHHERLDGSGYPAGIDASQIHRLTQLFSVVDEYEERVHQLGDQPGMAPINAMRSLYLDAQKGLLSEEIVAAFVSMLGVYPATTAVVLNTAEKAVVIYNNVEAPMAPVVDIHYDRQGQALAVPQRVDLWGQGSQVSLSIVKAIDPKITGVDPGRRLIVSEEQLG